MAAFDPLRTFAVHRHGNVNLKALTITEPSGSPPMKGCCSTKLRSISTKPSAVSGRFGGGQ